MHSVGYYLVHDRQNAYTLLGVIFAFLFPVIFVAVISRQAKRRGYFDELISAHIQNSEYQLHYAAIIRDELSVYHGFPLIEENKKDHFLITGNLNGEGFLFFQTTTPRPYSVLVLDAEKYEPKFASIQIEPQTLFNFGKDYQLEWGEFNRAFINKFDDPQQALEVVTPTFMESLATLRDTYGHVSIKYYSNDDYQKESLIIATKGRMFPVMQIRNDDELQLCFKKFLDFVKNGISLIESI